MALVQDLLPSMSSCAHSLHFTDNANSSISGVRSVHGFLLRRTTSSLFSWSCHFSALSYLRRTLFSVHSYWYNPMLFSLEVVFPLNVDWLWKQQVPHQQQMSNDSQNSQTQKDPGNMRKPRWSSELHTRLWSSILRYSSICLFRIPDN